MSPPRKRNDQSLADDDEPDDAVAHHGPVPSPEHEPGQEQVTEIIRQEGRA